MTTWIHSNINAANHSEHDCISFWALGELGSNMFFLNISILIEHEKSMALTFGIRLTLHTNIYSYHRNRLITESQYVSFIMQLFRNAQIDSIFEISVDIHYLVNWDFSSFSLCDFECKFCWLSDKAEQKEPPHQRIWKSRKYLQKGTGFCYPCWIWSGSQVRPWYHIAAVYLR